MQSWLILSAAIVCEVVATMMMEASQSLTRWRWVPPMLLFYVLALLGLALALRTLEVGIAYAVWAGAGTLLIAALGVIFFKESMSALKVLSMLLVIAGIVGLNLADSLARR
jgi:small multidrug resistance pump